MDLISRNQSNTEKFITSLLQQSHTFYCNAKKSSAIGFKLTTPNSFLNFQHYLSKSNKDKAYIVFKQHDLFPFNLLYALQSNTQHLAFDFPRFRLGLVNRTVFAVLDTSNELSNRTLRVYFQKYPRVFISFRDKSCPIFSFSSSLVHRTIKLSMTYMHDRFSLFKSFSYDLNIHDPASFLFGLALTNYQIPYVISFHISAINSGIQYLSSFQYKNHFLLLGPDFRIIQSDDVNYFLLQYKYANKDIGKFAVMYSECKFFARCKFDLNKYLTLKLNSEYGNEFRYWYRLTFNYE